MVSRSMRQRGKWARRIGGGALGLALVGMIAPATTIAAIYQDNTPEVIEIEGEAPEAPWNPETGTGAAITGQGRRTVLLRGTVVETVAEAAAGSTPAGAV
jgi:hypothetical protein